MIAKVSPEIALQKVKAPASKSYAQRAIFAAALGHSKCELVNLGSSEDVKHILAIAKQLGSEIEASTNGFTISPRTNEIQRSLNCGESGLGIRLTASIASTFGGKFEILGEGSLCKRPMNSFADFLPKLGVDFKSNNGFVPLEIDGKMNGGSIDIDGSMSSQFLSGILMSLPLTESDSLIQVNNLVSHAYTDMTLKLMADFGIASKSKDNKSYFISGNQEYTNPEKYIIEGDWSGAAFWIVLGAINGPIEIQGLDENSLQADRAILEVLKLTNAQYEWVNGNLIVRKSNLIPFEFDATNCPDLFPILTTLAASIKGDSIIHGVHRLKNKESNRGLTVQKEFSKLGLIIDLENDKMIIHGQQVLYSGKVHANHDHRIAMACAIAASLTDNGIEIDNAESVNKSYPEFWDVLYKVEINA
ncbi:MAG: 3-phosphoshikimate 1-carboxyvinyltransferase [Arenicella sp.]|jgi:3-phosphoshikimate 1-carboxyvinyltransferase